MSHKPHAVPPNLQFRTHLIQAYLNWIMELGWRPHVLVSTEHLSDPRVLAHAKGPEDGKRTIVFNLAPQAVGTLHLSDDGLYFTARFSGQSCEVFVPLDDVLYVFSPDAPEDKRALFAVGPLMEPDIGQNDVGQQDSKKPKERTAQSTNKPHLRAVK